MAYEPKSGILAAGQKKGGILMCRLAAEPQWNFFAETPRKARDLAFSPDGLKLAGAFWDGVRVWQVKDKKLQLELTGDGLDHRGDLPIRRPTSYGIERVLSRRGSVCQLNRK